MVENFQNKSGNVNKLLETSNKALASDLNIDWNCKGLVKIDEHRWRCGTQPYIHGASISAWTKVLTACMHSYARAYVLSACINV